MAVTESTDDLLFEAATLAGAQPWRDLLDSAGWALFVQVVQRRIESRDKALHSTAQTPSLAEVRALQEAIAALLWAKTTPERMIRQLTS